MKKINLIFPILLGFFALSCDDYLDETPDNRIDVDGQKKVQQLLVSAYPSNEYTTITELSTDNVVDFYTSNPNSDRFSEQLTYWKDVTEVDNSDPASLWSSCYAAIANANQALMSIEELGEENLQSEKGEALVARAYAHFILVNVFCKHYNTQTSATDLGVTYMEKAETTLNPQYERGNVADVYKKIEADLEAGLPLLKDDRYKVPLYHFTRKAAHAFAARFYLYYEKFDKAKEHASKVLAETKLRDWATMGKLPNKLDPKTNAYISDGANLLAFTATSSVGVRFGPYYSGSRFNHTRYIADNETFFSPMPWATSGVPEDAFNNSMWFATANNFNKVLFYKLPYLFQYTDPVQGIGYRKTVIIPFTADETLLVRAEAEALLGQTSEALADVNLWTQNFYAGGQETTMADINSFYNSLDYETADAISPKKKLSPKFAVAAGDQENLIHYILQCRRVLTIHEGLRWFDIKRYGIPVYRKQYQSDDSIITVETLAADDNRKAIQIPQDVASAGLEKNPR